MRYMFLKDIEEVFHKYKFYYGVQIFIFLIYLLYLKLSNLSLNYVFRTMNLNIFDISHELSFLDYALKFEYLAFYTGLIYFIIKSTFKKNIYNILLRMSIIKFFIYKLASILLITIFTYTFFYLICANINALSLWPVYLKLLYESVNFVLLISLVIFLRRHIAYLVFYLFIVVSFSNKFILNLCLMLIYVLFSKDGIEKVGGEI